MGGLAAEGVGFGIAYVFAEGPIEVRWLCCLCVSVPRLQPQSLKPVGSLSIVYACACCCCWLHTQSLGLTRILQEAYAQTGSCASINKIMDGESESATWLVAAAAYEFGVCGYTTTAPHP
jgi:hypothetical protein